MQHRYFEPLDPLLISYYLGLLLSWYLGIVVICYHNVLLILCCVSLLASQFRAVIVWCGTKCKIKLYNCKNPRLKDMHEYEYLLCSLRKGSSGYTHAK